MSSFKAKMHQIRLRLRLPQTSLGELTALPETTLAVFEKGEGKGSPQRN